MNNKVENFIKDFVKFTEEELEEDISKEEFLTWLSTKLSTLQKESYSECYDSGVEDGEMIGRKQVIEEAIKNINKEIPVFLTETAGGEREIVLKDDVLDLLKSLN